MGVRLLCKLLVLLARVFILMLLRIKGLMYAVGHLLVVEHQAGDIPSGASPGLKYASMDIPEDRF